MKTITIAGTPTIAQKSAFSPAIPYTRTIHGGSGYFDGTGDYLNIASNVAFGYGTGNFTIEGWFYLSVLPSSPNGAYIIDQRTAATQVVPTIYVNNDASLRFFTNGSDRITGGTIKPRQWYHFSLVKESNVTKLYLNGTQIGSNYADTNTYLSSPVYIGANYSGAMGVTGYFSNIRIVKGTAITPPAGGPAALVTAVTGTSLLLNFTNGGIFDESGFAKFIENNNGVATTTFKSSVGNGSLSFNNAGYLKVGNASDWTWMHGTSAQWTVDFWAYDASTAGGANRTIVSTGGSTGATTGIEIIKNTNNKIQALISNGIAGQQLSVESTGTIALSTWTHVSVTYDQGILSNNLSIALNGSDSGIANKNAYTPSSNAPSQTLYVGSKDGTTNFWNGYLDQLRVTKTPRRPLLVNATAQQGVNATFSVDKFLNISGVLSYQWKKDGTIVPDATSSTYTATEGVVGNHTIQCIILTTRNGSTSVAASSNIATLTTTAATVTIVTNPTSISLGSTTMAYTFTAAGTTAAGSIGYQWFKSPSTNLGSANGAQTATLTIPAAADSNDTSASGSYYCAVTNTTYGVTANTSSASITLVKPTLTINSQPASATVYAGVSNTFSVGATTSIGNLTYQWKKGGVDINGATSASYTATETTVGTYQYTCVVTNSTYNLTSTTDAATLTVNNAIVTINSQPANTTVGIGVAATISVGATTTAGTLSYQWKENGVNVGSNQNSYTVTKAAIGTFSIYCVITNAAYGTSATTNTITLTVETSPPVITVQPTGGNVILGNTISATVVGTPPLSYQWYRNNVSVGSANGGQTATYAPQDSADYKLIITNAYGTTTSNTVTVTILVSVTINSVTIGGQTVSNPPANATSSSAFVNITDSTASNVVVRTSGTGPVTYNIWRSNGGMDTQTNSTSEGTFLGNISTWTQGFSVNSNYMFGEAANSISDVWWAIRLTYYPSVSISGDGRIWPAGIWGAAKTSTTLYANVASVNPNGTYQWYKNGAPYGNGQSSLTVTEEGDYTFAFGSYVPTGQLVWSESAVFPVRTWIAITGDPSNPTSFTYKAGTNGTVDLSNFKVSYDYPRGNNGGDVDIYIDPNYGASWREATYVGNYLYAITRTITVNNSVGTRPVITFFIPDVFRRYHQGAVTFSPFYINYYDYITSVSIGSGNVTSAGAYTFTTATTNYGGGTSSTTGTTGTGTFTYQWYKDSVLINGATSSTYSANSDGSYYVKVTDGHGEVVQSQTRTLTVTPTITTQPTGSTSTTTTNYTLVFAAQAYNGRTMSYMWYADNQSIGVTTSSYTVAANFIQKGAGVGANFKCVATESVSNTTVTSNEVTVSFRPPSITTWSYNASTNTFSAQAQGAGYVDLYIFKAGITGPGLYGSIAWNAGGLNNGLSNSWQWEEATRGNYYVKAYDSSGYSAQSSNITAELVIEYMVVGGGGMVPGSTGASGGGGAGGMITGTNYIIAGTITVTIGAGGAAYGSATSYGPDPASGSSLGALTVLGGGAASLNTASPCNGGSGGGTYASNPTYGKGTPGQGNNGGTGAYSSTSTPTYYSAGGGGGAGGAGSNGTVTKDANGVPIDVTPGAAGPGLAWNGETYATGGSGTSKIGTTWKFEPYVIFRNISNTGNGANRTTSSTTAVNGNSGIAAIKYPGKYARASGGSISGQGTGTIVHTFTSTTNLIVT